MKRAIVTVGPQGAGKSTFCAKFVQAHPEIVLVNRDAILMQLFGKTYLSPYTGDHFVGLARMWQTVGEHFRNSDITLILDCWNGYADERKEIAAKLRSMGADIVEAWYFTTPREMCVEWFLAKEPDAHAGESERWKKIWRDVKIRSYRSDYRFYHRQPITLEQGFDSIHRINPLDPPSFALLLDEFLSSAAR